MPKVIDDILAGNILMRVRNNHALEHATLHVLQEKGLNPRLGGISDVGGFWIYGDVETEAIFTAAQEALKRLADGESKLAVHPNCGTNIAVGSLAAGGMAWLGMLGTGGKMGRKLRRLPFAVMLGLIGYQLAKPLGPKVQKQITTNADVTGLQVIEVISHDLRGSTFHRVSTRQAG